MYDPRASRPPRGFLALEAGCWRLFTATGPVLLVAVVALPLASG